MSAWTQHLPDTAGLTHYSLTRDREQSAQSLSRLEPDKIPAWTTGNARRVSALVRKRFKTGNSVEREFVFFNVQHWVVDQPHPGQAPWSSTVSPHKWTPRFISFYFMREKEYEYGGVGRLEKIWKALWDRKRYDQNILNSQRIN